MAFSNQMETVHPLCFKRESHAGRSVSHFCGLIPAVQVRRVGEWLELPAYISAVFEGALRSRQDHRKRGTGTAPEPAREPRGNRAGCLRADGTSRNKCL